MEKWDLYDKDFNKLTKTAFRGDKLNDDEYHLVINAWIVNDKNEFLITQRSKIKTYTGIWECTGGSAQYGDTSLSAALREVNEEIGIDISKCKYKVLGKTLRHYDGCPDILVVYIFKDNFDLKDIVMQDEIMGAQWASKDKILQLKKEGKFESNAFFNEAINTKYNEI